MPFASPNLPLPRSNRRTLMQIGKPLRTIIVEPLESPIPTKAPVPQPDELEPVEPTRKLTTEPVHNPVTP